MFERYTERARRVLFFARYEASQLGSVSIETEHLLLGLIREGRGLMSRVLARSNVSAEALRKELEGRTVSRGKVPASDEIPLSTETKRALAFATEEADRLLHTYIGTEHLLLGILREEQSLAASVLAGRGIGLGAVREDMVKSAPGRPPTPARATEATLIAEFGRDLTAAAGGHELDPLVGRELELERVVQVLCRRTKNNAVLVGDAGVGKTAIVEGLAQKIAAGDVPRFLAGKRLVALDLGLIVAGTKYRGQFEERLKGIVKELADDPNLIVFIDELHTLVGAGAAEGSLDAAAILKPALSRGQIRCIGATTPAEYRRHIEKDRALERRFQAVTVDAPSEAETIEILGGVKGRYEQFHHVEYTPDAIEAAVHQSSRYIADRFLPDKAIDVLDEAGARAKLRAVRADAADEAVGDTEKAVVGRAEIDEVVSSWTGVPVTSLGEGEGERLLGLEGQLHRRVVSQDRAVSALARAIRRARAGLKHPNRPVGSFIFLGPTGVGKTELARALAGCLFGSDRALVRFDMSEFTEKHSVSKLIGSPPGYVGHDEGGQLTERVRRHPYSVVLLDEIEKAHPEVFNVLLQVFEDGHLTDGLGTRVDFKNTVVILTSNLGARVLQKQGGVGFQSAVAAEVSRGVSEVAMAEVRRTFNPEFLNRIDEVIVFDPLSDGDLRRILALLVGQLNGQLAGRGLAVALTEAAADWIVDGTCRDRSYGARPLRRALQAHVEDPLSEALIRGAVRDGAIEVFVEGGALAFRPAGSATESHGLA
jgi:ATP-dependent Clp protease ATP-binding subunit ClpC